MRGIIEALTAASNPFSIRTKGTLILRDLDLLEQAAEVTSVSINASVGFLDRDIWRSVEPGTPSPAKRLEVCRTLSDAGLGCGVLMAPVLPFLTDSPAQLEATVVAIAAAGARHISPLVLHLRPGAREWYFGWLETHHPTLIPRYRELYGRGSYAPRSYCDEVTGRVYALATTLGMTPGRPTRGPSATQRRQVRPPATERTDAGQLSLL